MNNSILNYINCIMVAIFSLLCLSLEVGAKGNVSNDVFYGLSLGIDYENLENIIESLNNIRDISNSPRKLEGREGVTTYPQVIYLDLKDDTFIEISLSLSESKAYVTDIVITIPKALSVPLDQLSMKYGPPTDIKKFKHSTVYAWGARAQLDDVIEPLAGVKNTLRVEHVLMQQLVLRLTQHPSSTHQR